MDKDKGHCTFERWTARRKADLVLEIIKGQKTIVDAAREYDLKQSEIQNWIDTFMEYGRQGLRANPKKVESVYEEELKAHRARTMRFLTPLTLSCLLAPLEAESICPSRRFLRDQKKPYPLLSLRL